MRTLSWTRRQQLKAALKHGGRFFLTVACSVGVTLWVEHSVIQKGGFALFEKTTAKSKGRQASTESGVTGTGEAWSEELGDFYSQYLDEVLRTLRANRSVRMAKMDLPRAVLGYQRNLASQEKGGGSLRLQARSRLIPVIAVSRNSKAYLEEMRVTYIDPLTFPSSLLARETMTVSEATLKQFLLIPDVSGTNARKFLFGKN